MLLFEHSQNGRPLLIPSLEELNSIYLNILDKCNQPLEESYKINAQEAASMRSYYHTKIRDISQALDFSMAVTADAHFFLHKYFTRFSVLEHDLKHVMYFNNILLIGAYRFFRLACVYLATKCQNMHLTMDEFSKNIPNVQAELIVESELVVLQCIDFRPPSFSPVPCLFGFLMDYLQTVEGRVADDDIHERAQRALDHLQVALMIEEVVLLHPPSVISLACVLEHIDESETYWETRLGKLDNVTDLYTSIDSIKKLIDDFQDISTEQVKSIDKKIKLARQTISQ